MTFDLRVVAPEDASHIQSEHGLRSRPGDPNRQFRTASLAAGERLREPRQECLEAARHVRQAGVDQQVAFEVERKGKGISKIVIAPKEGATVKIDGKDVAGLKLKKGDKVSFYIPHDQ